MERYTLYIQYDLIERSLPWGHDIMGERRRYRAGSVVLYVVRENVYIYLLRRNIFKDNIVFSV